MKKEKKDVKNNETLTEETVKTEGVVSNQTEEPVLSEKERVKKEKTEWNYKRKVKRGFKALRGRRFKNFLFWLTGVISGLVILATTIFVGVGVVPIKTFFGDKANESVGNDVANKSLLGILLNLESYTESYSSISNAFPIVDKELKNLLSQAEGYVEIDFDSIKDIPFTDAEFSEKLMSSVKITATLESIGAESMLGDFINLPLFKDDTAIDQTTGEQITVKDVDTTVENFDYHLYTYKDQTSDEFLSASNEDGTDWAEAIKGTETPLYYVSLLTMPFSYLTNVITERLGVIKVVDLVEAFAKGSKDGLIGDILGDVDIKNMGTFDPSNIKISVLLDRYVKDPAGNDTTEETDLYKMLRNVLGVEEGEILVSHINGSFEFDTIKLSLFLDRYVKDPAGNDTTEETETYKMLRKILNVEEGEILVSHLTSGLDFDNVKISAFIDRFEADGETETETYKMLRNILNVEDGEILVSHLTSGLDFDNVKISAFIDRFVKDVHGNDTTEETEMYKLLRTIFSVPEGQEILVSHLSGTMSFDGVKLSDFIDRFEDDGVTETQMYNLLRTIFNVPEGQEILVSHLSGTMSFDGVKLSDFIDRFEDDGVTETQMYKLLRTIFNVPAGEEIKVSHLSGTMSFDGVNISDFIDRYVKDGDGNDTTEETEMYKLLRTLFGVEDGEIKVSDLNGTINFDGINASDFIDRFEADGKTETASFKLLRKITGKKDDEIAIGDIKSALSSGIKLSSFVTRYETVDGVETTTETQIYRIIRSAFNVPSDRDISVDDIGGTFNIDNVSISDFVSESSKIYEIILSATGKNKGDDVKLSALSSLSVNDCEISLFIPRGENADIYKIIENVITGDVDEYGDPVLDGDGNPIIRVKHLANFKIDNIKLEDVIDRYKKNASGEYVLVDGVKVETDLFKILSSVVVGSGEDGTILVKDLGSFDINEVKLSAVIDRTTYSSLYSIIDDTVDGTGEGGEVLVKDLKDFNINNLEISSIMNEEGKLYKIISDSVVGTGEGGKILIRDLSGFDTKNIKIKLEDVIERYEKDEGGNYVLVGGQKVENDLFRMLSSAVTGTGEDGAIMVSNLSTFSVGKLPITEVVNSETKLYQIIAQAVETGSGANGEIIVSDLTSNFEITRVSLATVVGSSENKILKTLISDESVTLANLGEKINNLELKEIFEAECFTTDVSKAVIYADSSMGRYRKVVRPSQDCHIYNEETCTCEQYVLESVGLSGDDYYVDDNIYYINKETQIWLFMYYNDDHSCDGNVGAEDFDADGFALSYKPMHFTFGNLESSVAKMSDEIKHASIRQLVSAGLMDPDPRFEKYGSTYIYAKTVNAAIAGN